MKSVFENKNTNVVSMLRKLHESELLVALKEIVSRYCEDNGLVLPLWVAVKVDVFASGLCIVDPSEGELLTVSDFGVFYKTPMGWDVLDTTIVARTLKIRTVL